MPKLWIIFHAGKFTRSELSLDAARRFIVEEIERVGDEGTWSVYEGYPCSVLVKKVERPKYEVRITR